MKTSMQWKIASLFPFDHSFSFFLDHNGNLWDIYQFTHTHWNSHRNMQHILKLIKIFQTKTQILVSIDTNYHFKGKWDNHRSSKCVWRIVAQEK